MKIKLSRVPGPFFSAVQLWKLLGSDLTDVNVGKAACQGNHACCLKAECID